jgi:hypothetical protein
MAQPFDTGAGEREIRARVVYHEAQLVEAEAIA